MSALLASLLEDWLAPHLQGLPAQPFRRAGLGRNTPGPAVLAAAGAESAGGASGSCIRLDWAEFPPVLAVRLQELFGLGDTLRIAGAGWR